MWYAKTTNLSLFKLVFRKEAGDNMSEQEWYQDIEITVKDTNDFYKKWDNAKPAILKALEEAGLDLQIISIRTWQGKDWSK